LGYMIGTTGWYDFVEAQVGIPRSERLISETLQSGGYATAAIGKWHLGYGKGDETPQWRTDYTAELSPGPLDIGFDYHFGVPSNHGDLTGVYVENRYVYGLSSGKVPEGMTIAGPAAGSEDYQATYEAKDTEGGKGGDRIRQPDPVLRLPTLSDGQGPPHRLRDEQHPGGHGR
jgi:hypothetical protein